MRGWTLHGRKYRKIQEKLKRTCITWKEEKGILEIQEINDFFSDMELDSDQMEKVFDYLEANNVDVLRISNDDDDIPDDIVMSDEDDIDVENRPFGAGWNQH